MNIKSLAKCQPLYGQMAVGSALRALGVAGHLRQARCAVGDGDNLRWVTRTFWSRTARDNEWWNTFLAAEATHRLAQPVAASATPLRRGSRPTPQPPPHPTSPSHPPPPGSYRPSAPGSRSPPRAETRHPPISPCPDWATQTSASGSPRTTAGSSRSWPPSGSHAVWTPIISSTPSPPGCP